MAKLSVDDDASCIITHAYQPCLLHSSPVNQLQSRLKPALQGSSLNHHMQVSYGLLLHCSESPSPSALSFKPTAREFSRLLSNLLCLQL